MAGTPRKKLTSLATRKRLRSQPDQVRQLCRDQWRTLFDEVSDKRARTRRETKIATEYQERLDCRATMLQAISIGREIPMLEPWIIDEIRRREEDRRRGELPRLEIPVPNVPWEDELDRGRKRSDESPERGVVIIGM
jgi:hypothetical protein